MRLVGEEGREWDSRGHFFAAAATEMRRILVENARRKGSRKRGGDRARADLDVNQLAAPELREDLLALDEALDRLAAADPEAARLVELRYFAGLTLAEAAKVVEVSPRTADRLRGLRPGLVAPSPRRRRVERAAIPKENGVIPPPISH